MTDKPPKVWILDVEGSDDPEMMFWTSDPAESLPADSPLLARVTVYSRFDVARAIEHQKYEAYMALVEIRDAGRNSVWQTSASKRAQAALDAIRDIPFPITSKDDSA